MDAGASGLGFVLWGLVLAVVYAGRGEKNSEEWRYAVAMISIYLGWYFFLDVGARVLDSGIPFLLLAGVSLKRAGARLFWGLWLTSGSIIWALQWNRTPFYGF